MKDIWNNIDKLQFKMNSELRVTRTPSNHSLPADIREKLLADQLDIYTLAFHPREYYGELGKDVADECAKNIAEWYNDIACDSGLHADDDCEEILTAILDELDS